MSLRFGGGSRIRTGDILLAKQTLYQLSYTPMVGLTRIELVTSSLSGTRSNQLSYKPISQNPEGTRNIDVCGGFLISSPPLSGRFHLFPLALVAQEDSP